MSSSFISPASPRILLLKPCCLADRQNEIRFLAAFDERLNYGQGYNQIAKSEDIGATYTAISDGSFENSGLHAGVYFLHYRRRLPTIISKDMTMFGKFANRFRLAVSCMNFPVSVR